MKQIALTDQFILLTLCVKPGHCRKVINSDADVNGLSKGVKKGYISFSLSLFNRNWHQTLCYCSGSEWGRNWLWMQLCLHCARAGSSSSNSCVNNEVTREHPYHETRIKCFDVDQSIARTNNPWGSLSTQLK